MIRGRLTGESRSPHEIREAVYLFAGDVGAKQSRFWLLLVLSTVIATAGVIADSTATVFGAMIIAPLAVPIQGAAVAIAYGELRPLLLSTAVVVGAMAVVVALAAAIAVVLPQLHPPSHNSQITGRASPTLVDLVAAAATGLAGAFAVGRRDIGDILPGVAIAISLVPPLAVVGTVAAARRLAHGGLEHTADRFGRVGRVPPYSRDRRSRNSRSRAFPVRSMPAAYARAASACRPSRRSKSARIA